jgi:hypothetical protein
MNFKEERLSISFNRSFLISPRKDYASSQISPSNIYILDCIAPRFTIPHTKKHNNFVEKNIIIRKDRKNVIKHLK